MIGGASAGFLATIISAFLLFLGTVLGLWLKRRTDKQDALERARQASLTAEANARQANYDQTQEDLKAAREEARALRVEMGAMWKQLEEMRRHYTDALSEAESHIADLERYIHEGSPPPPPSRRKARP